MLDLLEVFDGPFVSGVPHLARVDQNRYDVRALSSLSLSGRSRQTSIGKDAHLRHPSP